VRDGIISARGLGRKAKTFLEETEEGRLRASHCQMAHIRNREGSATEKTPRRSRSPTYDDGDGLRYAGPVPSAGKKEYLTLAKCSIAAMGGVSQLVWSSCGVFGGTRTVSSANWRSGYATFQIASGLQYKLSFTYKAGLKSLKG